MKTAPQQNEIAFHKAISFKELQRIVVKGKDKQGALKKVTKIAYHLYANALAVLLETATGLTLSQLISWAVDGEKIKDVALDQARLQEGAAAVYIAQQRHEQEMQKVFNLAVHTPLPDDADDDL